MNFRAKLSERIGIEDIREILQFTEQSDKKKQELYNLVFSEDERVSFQATWVFTHFSPQENEWLYSKQNELINEVLVCKHSGKRRLILNLLYKQPFPDTPRVDFLDFCLNRITSAKELPGVQSLCMKIAYELCRPIPELLLELKTTLEMMEDNLSPAVISTKRKLLQAIPKGISLQKFFR